MITDNDVEVFSNAVKMSKMVAELARLPTNVFFSHFSYTPYLVITYKKETVFNDWLTEKMKNSTSVKNLTNIRHAGLRGFIFEIESSSIFVCVDLINGV